MSRTVSVIIPVYNAAAYLDTCMESVFRQTYRDTEILLVDDGSADGSGELCDGYAKRDARVRVIHKENGGASSARNTGLDAASGDFIYFLDSDDRIVPELLEKLCAEAEEKGSELVFFDAYAVDEETGRVSETNYGHHERYQPDAGKNLMAKMTANKDFHVGVWQLLYRRSFFERTKLRFVEGIIYEDILFTCAAYCLAEKVSYVPEYLYYRLYHANSVMTAKKTMKNFISAGTVYYGVRDFSEHNDNVVPQAYLARAAYNVLTCAEALNAAERKSVAGKLADVKKDILAHDAYGDPALRMRCYGKALWAARRAIQKITG
ncbi:MAG: glycosyltransferase [Clostridia bacterium]|nr:glycosyltransferase [Clostridia bacterium]